MNARLRELDLHVIAVVVHACVRFDQDMHASGIIAVDLPGRFILLCRVAGTCGRCGLGALVAVVWVRGIVC